MRGWSMSLIPDISITSSIPDQRHGSETRKRKRDEAEPHHWDRRPFTIRPDTSEPFATPCTFTPLCLLSRAQLPLSYIDTPQRGSRLFTAHIPALERYEEHGCRTSVLVAEERKERRLYAIERAQLRTYALCRLGSWVSPRTLLDHNQVLFCQHDVQPKQEATERAENGRPWWDRAAVSVPADHTRTKSEPLVAPRLCLLSQVNTAITTPLSLAADTSDTGVAFASLAEADPASVAPRSPGELLQELSRHYLEALYLSRTSLAYFTKGPLSRIRAAVRSRDESALPISELIAFLRDTMLTASVMDKKYRDGVAGVVKELSDVRLDLPEQPAKPKRKRKWRSKRDKAGFYTDESEYIEKWWRSNDDGVDVSDSLDMIDAGLKRRMPCLRSRETYLQLIVALEILALEATHHPQAVPQIEVEDAAGLQGVGTQSQDFQNPPDGKKARTTRHRDVLPLLDTLVDRLCIWHSLEASSPDRSIDAPGSESTNVANDELKGFCVEIIIPFYMSRIPQHAATVNKKLGGPSAPAVSNRKPKSICKPGEPAMRPAPREAYRKPLARVTSDALKLPSEPIPSLRRSATDSGLLHQHIKREGSEMPTLLDDLPQAKATPQPRKRTSLMHSISFNAREVDLPAVSYANQTRLRKKAEVEEKLREAITILKKPNRARAITEVAEKTDLSFAQATAKHRLTGGRQPPKATQGVHITTTPKHGRTVKATPGPHAWMAGATGVRSVPHSSTRLEGHLFNAPPPSTFEVPQTEHRPTYGSRGGGVEETPSRRITKTSPASFASKAGPMESPIANRRRSVAHGKPPTNTIGVSVQDSPISMKRTFATAANQMPLKPLGSLSLVAPVSASLVASSPNVVRAMPPPNDNGVGQAGARSASVYDTLGWDEDDGKELA